MKYRFPFHSTFVTGTQYGVKGTAWKCGWHSGLDLKSANYGGDGKVYPIADGVVVSAGWTSAYGYNVRIQHDDGYLSLYAHLSTMKVRAGQTVTQDTCIGIEGSTGNSTGKHLHLEVHKGAYNYPSNIDPLAYLEQRITEEEEEMKYTKTTTRVRLNGIIKEVNTIQFEGTNYIKLRDLADSKIKVDYDAANNLPVVEVQ